MKNLLICTGYLAIAGLAWTAAHVYIVTVTTKDTVQRWREWVTA